MSEHWISATIFDGVGMDRTTKSRGIAGPLRAGMYRGRDDPFPQVLSLSGMISRSAIILPMAGLLSEIKVIRSAA